MSMYEPRELLAQPTTEFCNVLVIPDGKSAKHQRGCLVQVASCAFQRGGQIDCFAVKPCQWATSIKLHS